MGINHKQAQRGLAATKWLLRIPTRHWLKKPRYAALSGTKSQAHSVRTQSKSIASQIDGRSWRAAQSAFTVTEVLVAVMVVGMVAVSLYAAFAFGFASVNLAREDLRATQILLQRMESVRLYTWSQVTNATYFPTNFTEYYDPAGQATGSGGVAYTVTTTLSRNPSFAPLAAYSPDMLLVKVQLAWTSGKIPRRREMSTYVARHGLQNYVFNQ